MAKGRAQPLGVVSLPDVGLGPQCTSVLEAHRRQGHLPKCILSGAHGSSPRETSQPATTLVSPTVM